MITIRGLRKTFGDDAGAPQPAVADVSFTVDDGHFYVLLGPSGSGKTTTLRCIAGLEKPEAGEIQIDGKPVVSISEGLIVPAESRPIGMVFQSYALWPHMNVSENIVFPLRHGSRRISKKDAQVRLERVLSILQLEPFAKRPVTKLSGGQQQRVALARAIALEPKVLLMDEPLSNLDAKLRAEVRTELKNLTDRLGITTLYVTHDQIEALVLGDEIGVMNGGRILQESPPWELYREPRDLFVAQFLGDVNLIDGVTMVVDGTTCVVDTPFGEIRASCPRSLHVGQRASLVVRMDDLRRANGSGANQVEAVVRARQFLGESFLFDLSLGEQTLKIKLPVDQPLERGERFMLEIPASRAFVFAAAPRSQIAIN